MTVGGFGFSTVVKLHVAFNENYPGEVAICIIAGFSEFQITIVILNTR